MHGGVRGAGDCHRRRRAGRAKSRGGLSRPVASYRDIPGPSQQFPGQFSSAGLIRQICGIGQSAAEAEPQFGPAACCARKGGGGCFLVGACVRVGGRAITLRHPRSLAACRSIAPIQLLVISIFFGTKKPRTMPGLKFASEIRAISTGQRPARHSRQNGS